jgi:hypothetical protein
VHKWHRETDDGGVLFDPRTTSRLKLRGQSIKPSEVEHCFDQALFPDLGKASVAVKLVRPLLGALITGPDLILLMIRPQQHLTPFGRHVKIKLLISLEVNPMLVVKLLTLILSTLSMQPRRI